MENQDPGGGISNKILYIVSLNHFINDGSTYLISSLFPAIIISFGFSEYQIGILVAVGYLVNLVFQPITGRYSERYEARKLLALGISLIAISMFLFIVANGFAMMLLAMLVLRFGSSFYHPVGVSAISRTYRGIRLDSSMGFQSAFGNLGVVLAFLFSAPLYLAIGWKGPFLIYAALEAGTVLVTLIAMHVKTSLEPKPKEIPSDQNKLPLGIPLFFIITAFVTGGNYAIFGNFGNLFLFRHGFGLSLSNYIMATWVVSAFVGAMLVGRITKRIPRLRLLVLSYFLAGLSALVFGLSGHNLAIALVGLLVNGFLVSATYPMIYSELSAYLGERSKGVAFGILFSSNIGGSSVLGFLGGYIGASFGLVLLFEVVSLILLFSVLPTLFWSRSRSASTKIV